jgi:hypothetical protein
MKISEELFRDKVKKASLIGGGDIKWSMKRSEGLDQLKQYLQRPSRTEGSFACLHR